MTPELRNLIEAGLFALGYIVGKEGTDTPGVIFLARALKAAGAESSHLDAILESAQRKAREA